MKFAIASHLPGLSLEEEAPLLAKNGYTGWEVSLPTADLRKGTQSLAQLRGRARQLKTLAESHGLQNVAIGVGLTPRHMAADPGYVRNVFELIREAGSTGVRMSGVHYNDPPPPPRQIDGMDEIAASYHRGMTSFHPFFAEQRALLVQMAQEAERHGVRLLLEIHPYYIHNSPSAMLRLIEGCSPAAVGALLDPQGLAMQGHEGSRQSVDVLRDYVAHIHVKDSLLTRLESGKLRHVPKALPEGTTQWPLLVATLKWIGFDGFWFDEDFRGVGLEERLQTKRYLEDLWEKAPAEPGPEFCLKCYHEHFG